MPLTRPCALEKLQESKAERKVFYTMNRIAHAEIWQDHDHPRQYNVALCQSDDSGFRATNAMSKTECAAWLKAYAPEIKLKA